MSRMKVPHWYNSKGSEQSSLDAHFKITGEELETPKNSTKCKPKETRTLQPVFTPLSNGMPASIAIESKKNVAKIFPTDDSHEKSKNPSREIMSKTYLVNSNFPRAFNPEISAPQSINSKDLCDINPAIFANLSRLKAPQWYDFEASEQSGLDGFFETIGKEVETPKNPPKWKPKENQTPQPTSMLLYDMPSPIAIEPKKYFEKISSSDDSHEKSKNQPGEIMRETYLVNPNFPERFHYEILAPQSTSSREFYDENFTKKILHENSNASMTENVFQKHCSFATLSSDSSVASWMNRKMIETPPKMKDHEYPDSDRTIESLTKAMKNLYLRSEKQILEISEISLLPNAWKMGVEVDAQTSMAPVTSKNEIVAKNIEATVKDQNMYSDEILGMKNVAIPTKILNTQVLKCLDKMQEKNNNFVLEKMNEGNENYFKSGNGTKIAIILEKPVVIDGENSDIESEDGKSMHIIAGKLTNTGNNDENAGASLSSNIVEFSSKGLSGDAKSLEICHKMVQTKDKKPRVLANIKYRRQSRQFNSLAVGMEFHKDTPKRFQTSSKIRSQKTRRNELTLTSTSSPTSWSKSRTKSIKFPNGKERERLEVEEPCQNCKKPYAPKIKKMKKNVIESPSSILQYESSTNSSKFSNQEKKKLKIEEIRQNGIQTHTRKPKKIKEKVIADSTSPSIPVLEALNLNLPPPEFQKSAKKRTPKKKIVTTIVSMDEEVVGLKDDEILYFGIPIGKDCKKRTPMKPFSFDVREKKIGEKTMAKKFQAGAASSLTATTETMNSDQVSKVPIQRNIKKERNMADGPIFRERNDILLKKKNFVDQAREREKEARHFQAKPVPIFKPVLVPGTCSSRALYLTKRTRNLSPIGTSANKENRPPNASSTQQFEKLTIPDTTENCRPKRTNPKPPILNADERVKRRRIFDAMIRRKDEEAEARRREEENERLECEERKKKELRKNMKRKAQPMPIFKTPKIAKSLKPLTDPLSPAWAGRKLLS